MSERLDEGDIDMDFAGLDGADTSAVERMMRKVFNRPVEIASPDLSADTGGLDSL